MSSLRNFLRRSLVGGTLSSITRSLILNGLHAFKLTNRFALLITPIFSSIKKNSPRRQTNQQNQQNSSFQYTPKWLSNRRTVPSIEGDFSREPVIFRLILSWEVRNFRRGNALMGLELLLIDLKGATMQGFVAAFHIFRFESILNAGGIYKLNKFMLVLARDMYKVSANNAVVVFSDQTTLAEIDGAKYEVMPQAFRIRNHKELSSIADRNGDLFDILGCIKNVTGDDFGTPA